LFGAIQSKSWASVFSFLWPNGAFNDCMPRKSLNSSVGAFLVAAFSFCGPVRTDGAVQITKSTYHSWPEAFTLSNGTVEVLVVPAIGRIMQFRFVGENDGPFWENHALDGKAADSQSPEWINFGGDKTWPAPQEQWAKVTGRSWPPPKAFDSMPLEASIDGETLVLRSKIDLSYGIQTERRIRLKGSEPEMEIETKYLKLERGPMPVAIWIITQLKDPEKMYVPIPKNTLFPSGYNKQSEVLPADLKFSDSLLTCTRSPRDSTKIGTDASDLLWADAKWIMHIHAQRESEGEFPDKSSSAEIYTNPDPKKYVELETLGPLHTLKRRETLGRRQTYRLYRRNDGPLDAQIASILKRS
jgi:hypothetical protein